MRRFNATIFDQTIDGSNAFTLYTGAQHASVLGAQDRLAFHVLVSRVPVSLVSGFTQTLTVAIEHSADGVHWLQKNTVGELDDVNVNFAGQRFFYAADPLWFLPSLRFVRLRVHLAGVSAHVVIKATLRDTSKPENPISELFWGWVDEMSPEVLVELADVLEHIPRLSPAAWVELAELATESKQVELNSRFDYVFSRTSPETSREIEPIGRAIARLGPLAAQGLFNRLVKKTRRDMAEALDADVENTMTVRNWKIFQEPPADRPGADTGSLSWLDVRAEPELFVNWTSRAHGRKRRRHVRPHEVHRLARRLTRRHAARLTYLAVQMLSPHEIMDDTPTRVAAETRTREVARCACEGQCGPCAEKRAPTVSAEMDTP